MVESFNVSISVQGQKSNEAQIGAEEQPGENAGPCKDEMDDEDDRKKHTRLPGVKPHVVAFVFQKQ